MRFSAAIKGDANLWVEAVPPADGEIRTGVEDESVGAGGRIRDQVAASSIFVRDTGSSSDPRIAFSPLQPESNTHSRLSQHCIQDMRRDPAHEINHFPSRI